MPSASRSRVTLLAVVAALGLSEPGTTRAAPPKRPTPTPAPGPTPTPTAAAGSVQILITDPAPGTAIAGNRYNVRGTVVGPINTGVTINDEIAYCAGGRFLANDVVLEPGANTIRAVATAASGETASASTEIQAASTPPLLALRADVTAGVAPLTVTFSYVFGSTVAVTSASLDFDGDGRFDYQNKKTPAEPVQNVYSQAGLYLALLKVTDANRREYTATLGIEVVSLEQLDALFASVWDGMNSALLQRDVSRALRGLNARAAEEYGPVFRELLPDMPSIIASYSHPQRASVRRDALEYAVNRTIRGEDRIFLVYLVRDADGVWRIDSM